MWNVSAFVVCRVTGVTGRLGPRWLGCSRAEGRCIGRWGVGLSGPCGIRGAAQQRRGHGGPGPPAKPSRAQGAHGRRDDDRSTGMHRNVVTPDHSDGT
jgi:hypothetical protein